LVTPGIEGMGVRLTGTVIVGLTVGVVACDSSSVSLAPALEWTWVIEKVQELMRRSKMMPSIAIQIRQATPTTKGFFS
jgi:hypothetical protein